MNPLRIGVLASHGGSNMQAIVDRIAAGRLDARIVLVISNNSQSGAMERARKAGLPTLHLSNLTHPDESARDAAMRDAMVGAGAELIVLAGYMKHIGPLTLERFAGRILNIHPALLPRHGGRGLYGIKPHESVLASGDAETGPTVHLVDPQYDHGPTIRQRRVPVLPGDTPETLQARVLKEEHEIYSEVIADIAAGKIELPIIAQ
ncbi:MAG: phosphoribosylglycinamide formyltransferase [Candidatus Sumerlaeia bacterium]